MSRLLRKSFESRPNRCLIASLIKKFQELNPPSSFNPCKSGLHSLFNKVIHKTMNTGNSTKIAASIVMDNIRIRTPRLWVWMCIWMLNRLSVRTTMFPVMCTQIGSVFSLFDIR